MVLIARTYFVYILTNHPHGTLYIGVTNSIRRRIWQHRNGTNAGFAHRYGLQRLVHLERFEDVQNAIRREKEIKGWLRRRKVELIERENPRWADLADEVMAWDD